MGAVIGGLVSFLFALILVAVIVGFYGQFLFV